MTQNSWSQNLNLSSNCMTCSPHYSVFSGTHYDSSCRLWVIALHWGDFTEGRTVSWLRAGLCSQAPWTETLAPPFPSWDLLHGTHLLHGWVSSSVEWQVGWMKSQLLPFHVPSTPWQWAHSSLRAAQQERHNQLGREAFEVKGWKEFWNLEDSSELGEKKIQKYLVGNLEVIYDL